MFYKIYFNVIYIIFISSQLNQSNIADNSSQLILEDNPSYELLTKIQFTMNYHDESLREDVPVSVNPCYVMIDKSTRSV